MRQKFGSVVLDAAARLLAPYILIFSLYVIFHGHYSPGGGFQGGTIAAAAIILMRLVGGEKSWGFGRETALLLACAGVGLFTAVGIGAMIFGGVFLDYAAYPMSLPPAPARAMFTLVVEAGIALGVMGVMVLIFDLLVRDEA